MYKRILVPLDGSDAAERGLTEALALARSVGASLQLLHVVMDWRWMVDPMLITAPADLRGDIRRFGEDLLAKAAKRCEAAGVVAQTRLREALGSHVGHVIVDEVTTSACDAIVMGTHGRKGAARLLLGSDAAWVAHASPVPVLLVRQNAVVT
jgi:nucleotide-binding universal stress UspA family protein